MQCNAVHKRVRAFVQVRILPDKETQSKHAFCTSKHIPYYAVVFWHLTEKVSHSLDFSLKHLSFEEVFSSLPISSPLITHGLTCPQNPSQTLPVIQQNGQFQLAEAWAPNTRTCHIIPKLYSSIQIFTSAIKSGIMITDTKVPWGVSILRLFSSCGPRNPRIQLQL